MDTHHVLTAGPTCTVDQAANALGLSRAAVYDAVARGDIAHVRVGRKILIATRPLADALGVAALSLQHLRPAPLGYGPPPTFTIVTNAGSPSQGPRGSVGAACATTSTECAVVALPNAGCPRWST